VNEDIRHQYEFLRDFFDVHSFEELCDLKDKDWRKMYKLLEDYIDSPSWCSFSRWCISRECFVALVHAFGFCSV
jgi:hypothetical protein